MVPGPSKGQAQGRAIVVSQANTPARSNVTSMVAGSMDSTRQPPAKLARISSWLTRRGPKSPGCRSLKQRMWYRPSGARTARCVPSPYPSPGRWPWRRCRSRLPRAPAPQPSERARRSRTRRPAPVPGRNRTRPGGGTGVAVARCPTGASPNTWRRTPPGCGGGTASSPGTPLAIRTQGELSWNRRVRADSRAGSTSWEAGDLTAGNEALARAARELGAGRRLMERGEAR